MDHQLKLSKKRTKSTNSSPRDISKDSPRDHSPASRFGSTFVCPRCKTSINVVRLGRWKEKDASVYFCGLNYPDEKACRNIWMPDLSHVQIEQVNIRYLPGPDGDYIVTFT